MGTRMAQTHAAVCVNIGFNLCRLQGERQQYSDLWNQLDDFSMWLDKVQNSLRAVQSPPAEHELKELKASMLQLAHFK